MTTPTRVGYHGFMPRDLHAEIRFETLADGVRYVLPRPQLSAYREGGFIALFLGLCFSGFTLALIWRGMRIMWEGGSGLHWPGPVLVLIGLLLLLGALVPLILGLYMLLGHGEIEFRGGKVYAVRHLGAFRWRRSRSADGIQRLVLDQPRLVGPTRQSRNTSLYDAAAWAGLYELWGDGRNICPLTFATGYPHRWLADLAADLSERLGSVGPGRLTGEDRPEVKIIERDEDGEVIEDEEVSLDQPSDSQITLERHPDGLTLTLPPMGIGESGGTLLVGSAIWLGILCFITLCGFFGGDGESNGGALGAILVFSIFWGVGIGMAAAALNMARRRAVVDIVGDTLLVTRQGLFGTRQQEWTADQFRAIRKGRGGPMADNEPGMELQLYLRRGQKVGLFSGRKNAEIDWLAAVLRDELNLPAR